MFWRKCVIVGIGLALFWPYLSRADWSISRPGAGEQWKNNKTVNGKGTGEDGIAADLYVAVFTGGTEANAGTGTWSGGMGAHWLVDVAAPTGGWTNTDAAVMKVWIEGQQPAPNFIKESVTFEFVDPPAP
jgi:hypothetical protein